MNWSIWQIMIIVIGISRMSSYDIVGHKEQSACNIPDIPSMTMTTATTFQPHPPPPSPKPPLTPDLPQESKAKPIPPPALPPPNQKRKGLFGSKER